jgi:hypothetical protein
MFVPLPGAPPMFAATLRLHHFFNNFSRISRSFGGNGESVLQLPATPRTGKTGEILFPQIDTTYLERAISPTSIFGSFMGNYSPITT